MEFHSRTARNGEANNFSVFAEGGVEVKKEGMGNGVDAVAAFGVRIFSIYGEVPHYRLELEWQGWKWVEGLRCHFGRMWRVCWLGF